MWARVVLLWYRHLERPGGSLPEVVHSLRLAPTALREERVEPARRAVAVEMGPVVLVAMGERERTRALQLKGQGGEIKLRGEIWLSKPLSRLNTHIPSLPSDLRLLDVVEAFAMAEVEDELIPHVLAIA